MAGEIFISYRRSDLAKAQRLVELLKAEGVEAWHDAQIGAGQDWRQATAAALAHAPIFVLLFSKAAAASDDIAKELAAATFSKKLVVPVRLENIQPEGAFLYELASRNWIDAYENTDVHLTDLAQNLAQVVKRGADAAAIVHFEHGRSTAPVSKSLPMPRKWMIAGGAALAVALLATTAFAMFGGDRAKAVSGRIAFFGVEAPAGDRDLAAAARAAGDTIRATFAAQQQDMAASADTGAIPAKERLDRALQLGAQYAVSGVATRRGEAITISILLEDAPSRTIIWPAAFDGKASDPETLASRVAALLTDQMVCILNVRSSLRKDDIRIVTRLPDACASIRIAQAGNAERWQSLADLAPDSAWVQAGLAFALFTAIPDAAPAAVDNLRRRARTAIARAEAIDPELPELFSARARASRDAGEGQAKEEAIYLQGLKTGRPAPNLNGQYSALLWGAGRVSDARNYLMQAFALDPLSAPKMLAVADYVSHSGGGAAAAEALYAKRHAQFPDGTEWQDHVIAALFHKVGDIGAILADRPQEASEPLATCLADIARLVRKGTGPAKMEAITRITACRDSAAMRTNRANEMLAFLGEFDAAYTMSEVTDPSFRVIFDPALPALRVQPGFERWARDSGLIDYWRAGHPPDFCATEKAPVCSVIQSTPPK